MWTSALITAILVALLTFIQNTDGAEIHSRTNEIILKNQKDGSRIGTIEEHKNETVIRDRNGNVMGRSQHFTNAPGDYTIWDNHGNPMGYIKRTPVPSRGHHGGKH